MARLMNPLRRAWTLGVIGAAGLLLAACNTDGTTNNTVSGTPSQFSYSTGAGTSVEIPITFTTSSNTAARLSITNLASFPAGLAVPGAATCQTITTSGSSCVIYLEYTPTEPAASSSFTVEYSYYNASGALQTGTVSFDYAATTNSPSFGYVADAGGNLYSCAVDGSGDSTNGSFSHCTPTPSTSAPWNGLNPPTAIAFGSTSGSTYAYVTEPLGESLGAVQKCSVNDGVLSNCAQDPSEGVLGWVPNNITLQAANGINYAYVTSVANLLGTVVGSLYQCQIDSQGNLINGSCEPQLGPGTAIPYVAPAWRPNAIAFGGVDGKTYAYVADNSSTLTRGLYQCQLNQLSSGSVSSCTMATGTGIPSGWIPNDVKIATVNDTTFGYVVDKTNGHIYQCTLNSNGSFNTCTATAPASPSGWNPSSISIRSVDGTTYAYVTASLDGFFPAVYQCSLKADGTLNVCNTTPTGSSAPSWIPTNLGLN